MPKPRVSILINNYNYGAFVGRALASALEQEGPSAEVIVVDDGSNDDSRAVLQAFGQRAQFIYQSNRGQASAINTAVRESRGELLCFLDADDWWVPGKIGAIMAAFDADPRVVLAYHRLQPVLANGTYTLKPIPRSLCTGDLKRRMMRSAGWWPFPMTSAVAVRRSTWAEAGDIPERLRISADAWLVGVYPFLGLVAGLPETLGFYRIHANAWYREADDAPMLRKRVAHWQASVDAINGFLSSRGGSERLRLADHFPYHVAVGRLAGVDLARRFRLALQGLAFPGEPNALRRVRDVLRLVVDLPRSPRRSVSGP